MNKYTGSMIFNVVLTEKSNLVRISGASTTYMNRIATKEMKKNRFFKKIIVSTLHPHEHDDPHVHSYFDEYKRLIKEEILKGEHEIW